VVVTMKASLVYPLVVLCAYSDVAATLLAMLGVGMGAVDTLRQHGAGTGTALAVALPLAALAAWGTARLWYWPLPGGKGQALADVYSELADRIADWGGLEEYDPADEDGR